MDVFNISHSFCLFITMKSHSIEEGHYNPVLAQNTSKILQSLFRIETPLIGINCVLLSVSSRVERYTETDFASLQRCATAFNKNALSDEYIAIFLKRRLSLAGIIKRFINSLKHPSAKLR